MQGNPAKAHVLYAAVKADDQAKRLLSAIRIHGDKLPYSDTVKETQGTMGNYCHLTKAGYRMI